MPYSVLKISKIVEDRIDVAGEFPDETAAYKFIELEQIAATANGTHEDHEYTVEPPPTILAR
jgi:hypothetical protein